MTSLLLLASLAAAAPSGRFRSEPVAIARDVISSARPSWQKPLVSYLAGDIGLEALQQALVERPGPAPLTAADAVVDFRKLEALDAAFAAGAPSPEQAERFEGFLQVARAERLLHAERLAGPVERALRKAGGAFPAGEAAEVRGSERERASVLRKASGPAAEKAPPAVAAGREALRTLATPADVDAALAPFSAGVLIVGYGTKSQYKDVSAIHGALDAEVARLDSLHGKGRWLGIIGGDAYVQANPDIAHVVRYLQKSHGIRFLAVQNDAALQFGGVDKSLDFVHYVPTERKLDGTTIWGGVVDGMPVGPSRFVFGHLLDGPRPLLKSVLAAGGGPVAREEALYARDRRLGVTYIRAEARFPEVNGPYGSLEGLFPDSGAAAKPTGRLLMLLSALFLALSAVLRAAKR